MLPKGTLRHAKFGESAYVAYARFKKGETPISPLDGRPFGVLNDSLTFLVGCFESPNLMVLHHNLDGDANPTISLGHLEEAVRQGNDDTNRRLYAGLDEDDRQLIQQTMHYVFNTLMIMLSRPQLVERGKASGKRSKRGAEFWSPNIIGARYVVQRARVVGAVGTHASPREHWRRGHWRQRTARSTASGKISGSSRYVSARQSERSFCFGLRGRLRLQRRPQGAALGGLWHHLKS
jgi:hypothetical protein